MATSNKRTWLAAVPPYAWLLVFFLFPFALVAKLSVSHTVLAIPPYAPTLDWSRGGAGIGEFIRGLSGETYARLTQDQLYLASYLSSLKVAAVSTLLLLLIGYPMAYGMARAAPRSRTLLLMAVILPFWTSFLIRVYAWIAILKPEGLLNLALGRVGLGPVEILNTPTAVYIGVIYSYLPFMVLPLYAALEKLDITLLEAAADLGASPWRAFWRVTFPLSWPGVVAGSLLCFIPIVGEFVIPDLLGGPGSLMIGRTIWTEFFADRDWPSASAVAIVLLATLTVPILIYQHQQARALERRG
ncbi:MAG TPA: ABC transporter permease subunit [Caulobacteraceae bacterium]